MYLLMFHCIWVRRLNVVPFNTEVKSCPLLFHCSWVKRLNVVPFNTEVKLYILYCCLLYTSDAADES